MRRYIKIAAVALAALSLLACRKESDPLSNFSYNDALAFGDAENSFGGKFKVLWEGLNSNYAIWDYEASFGLDWDEVYETYYPKFVELDTLALKRQITDKELSDLLAQVVAPLHDGHLFVSMKNHSTGGFAEAIPGDLRNDKERKQEMADADSLGRPSLAYYELKGIAKDVRDFDATPRAQFQASRDSALKWTNKLLDDFAAKTVLTAEDFATQRLAQDVQGELAKLDDITDNKELIAAFNQVALRYSYLNIPGFHLLDDSLFEKGIRMASAVLNGNIAYLTFSNFEIEPYLKEFPNKAKEMQPYAAQLAAGVKEAWDAWFSSIQTLHQSGQLGGVIIDLRGNGGGSQPDYQYVLGALLPAGGHHAMYTRTKQGVGRYDYSTLIPLELKTYPEEHVTVTEPIVVLVNGRSVSMSEVTSVGAREVENAKIVGTRTWGGLCALQGNDAYSYAYAGHIGVEGVTPVYVYCPSAACFDTHGNLLEGVGVTPDIEVQLDVKALKKGNGPDNQLDRAIEYIVSGK